MVLFFQVILAEQWDDIQEEQLCARGTGKVGPLNVSQGRLSLV